jgi:hypothetical protein
VISISPPLKAGIHEPQMNGLSVNPTARVAVIGIRTDDGDTWFLCVHYDGSSQYVRGDILRFTVEPSMIAVAPPVVLRVATDA